jgi:hypothetical protein
MTRIVGNAKTGVPHSKTLARHSMPGQSRSVLEYGTPVPLSIPAGQAMAPLVSSD